MKFKSKSISSYILYDTRVENIFISEYMPKAPDLCVRAYLLGLMYAQMGQPADDESMARSLGITAAQLLDCWRYWEDEGLVRLSMEDGESELSFLSLKEMAFGTPPQEEPEKPFIGDKKAAKLFADIEALTGALLQSRDIEDISEWVSSLGMTPEFILAGYRYCASRKKSTGCRYVGRILKDWKSKGLTDEDSIRDYLQDNDRRYDLYRRVFRALGFTNNPTEEQKRLMDSWTEEMGFSIDKILQACDKTAGISNPNIKYVDSVLRNWYSEAQNPAKAPEEDLIARVMQLYAEDRQANERKTEEQRERIFAQIPRVYEITGELKDASYKLSRAMFASSGGAAAEAQKKRIALLNREKAELLKKAGYSENATDKIYTCSRCRDTGELEDGSRCPCFNEKLAFVQSGFAG